MTWGVYMAIFLQKHKQELNDMLLYQECINKLIRRQAYGRQFRIDREHVMYSWDSAKCFHAH